VSEHIISIWLVSGLIGFLFFSVSSRFEGTLLENDPYDAVKVLVFCAVCGVIALIISILFTIDVYRDVVLIWLCKERKLTGKQPKAAGEGE